MSEKEASVTFDPLEPVLGWDGTEAPTPKEEPGQAPSVLRSSTHGAQYVACLNGLRSDEDVKMTMAKMIGMKIVEAMVRRKKYRAGAVAIGIIKLSLEEALKLKAIPALVLGQIGPRFGVGVVTEDIAGEVVEDEPGRPEEAASEGGPATEGSDG